MDASCDQLRHRLPPVTSAPVIEVDDRSIVLDLSVGARLQGQEIIGLDVASLGALIDATMRDADTGFAFGKYGEPRELYDNDNFSTSDSSETRTIHLGLDVFCAAGTPVFAPIDGRVEILANNARELDYGPMIVLRHEIPNEDCFYTLYGHLGIDALTRVSVGQDVNAGEQIATVGEPPTNGNWPPHLHFQEISDLLGLGADFPGVALKSQQQYWFGLSPSPSRFFPDMEAASLEYV